MPGGKQLDSRDDALRAAAATAGESAVWVPAGQVGAVYGAAGRYVVLAGAKPRDECICSAAGQLFAVDDDSGGAAPLAAAGFGAADRHRHGNVDGNAAVYPVSDGDGHDDRDGDAAEYGHGNIATPDNGDRFTYGDCHSDGDATAHGHDDACCDGDGDGSGRHGNAVLDTNGRCHRDGDADEYRAAHGDGDAASHGNADAAADGHQHAGADEYAGADGRSYQHTTANGNAAALSWWLRIRCVISLSCTVS